MLLLLLITCIFKKLFIQKESIQRIFIKWPFCGRYCVKLGDREIDKIILSALNEVLIIKVESQSLNIIDKNTQGPKPLRKPTPIPLLVGGGKLGRLDFQEEITLGLI